MATATAATDSYARLIDRIDRARWRWRRVRVTSALGWWMAATVAGALACLVLDNWLHLGATVRVAMLVGVGVAVVVGAVLLVGRWGLHRPDDDGLALYLEHRVPQIDGRLINAVQIGRNGNGSAGPFADALVAESYH